MTTSRALAFDLIEGLLTEDATVLDRTAKAIEDGDMTNSVLCSVSAMLCAALVSTYGDIGALAALDRARAEHSAMWGDS